MSYEKTSELFNKTFGNDYAYVKHPELAPVGPFIQEVEPRYNLTLLPKADDWYKGMGSVRTIIVNCMDRDVSPRIPRDKTRSVVTIAGGIVQNNDRQSVLTDFFGQLSQDFTAGNLPNLHKISLGGHNHTCGYVGAELGQSLPGFLGCAPRSPQEDAYMKRLIINGAYRVLEPFKGVKGLEITTGLFDTQRNVQEPLTSFKPFNHLETHPLSIEELCSYPNQITA
mgnify:CR=1 FL=1